MSDQGKWLIQGEQLVDDTPHVRVSLADVEIPGHARFTQYVFRMRRAALAGVLMYAIMYIWGWVVKVMSMSESRANYAATLDSVINDQEEVVITRPGGEDVVMIPLREYESMRETLYLMSSPVNRQRISRSIEQLNRGRGQVRELIDPDGDGG